MLIKVAPVDIWDINCLAHEFFEEIWGKAYRYICEYSLNDNKRGTHCVSLSSSIPRVALMMIIGYGRKYIILTLIGSTWSMLPRPISRHIRPWSVHRALVMSTVMLREWPSHVRGRWRMVMRHRVWRSMIGIINTQPENTANHTTIVPVKQWRDISWINLLVWIWRMKLFIQQIPRWLMLVMSYLVLIRPLIRRDQCGLSQP